MSADKLARRYAKALFDEALNINKLEAIRTDILSIESVLQESKDLKSFFSNPIINSDKKKAVVNQLFGNAISKEVKDFLLLLIEKGRESYISDIIDMFNKLYNQHNNITKVNITTAVDIDAQVEQSIKDLITKKTGKSNFIIKKDINPTILGGFVAKIDDTIIDASVSTRLQKISKELIYN